MRSNWIKAACLISMGIGASAASAQTQGLHNRTKTFTSPEQMKAVDWSDPAELDRSWQAAIVRVPTGRGKSKLTTVAGLAGLAPEGGVKYPTIIYLHGCSGFWSGTYERIEYFANNRYLVIAPASFARLKYPRSCDVDTYESGLYRRTLTMRQNDAGYAIQKAKELAIVDADRIALVGLSQGAITAVTFEAENDRQLVSARVAEGWTCHGGWTEYSGVNAPPDEPVLSLVGLNDPWFQNYWSKGSCSEYMNRNNGSKSVIYRTGPLANHHELLDFSLPRREVIRFLNKHLEMPLTGYGPRKAEK